MMTASIHFVSIITKFILITLLNKGSWGLVAKIRPFNSQWRRNWKKYLTFFDTNRIERVEFWRRGIKAFWRRLVSFNFSYCIIIIFIASKTHSSVQRIYEDRDENPNLATRVYGKHFFISSWEEFFNHWAALLRKVDFFSQNVCVAFAKTIQENTECCLP